MTASGTGLRHCPSRPQLESLLANQLSDADRAAVAAHVDGCARCQETLGHLTEGADTEHWRRLYARRSGPCRVPGDPWWPCPMPPLEGAGARAEEERPTVPGYELGEELGRGGMGVVYKARQLRLNRTVALKMILAGNYAGPAQLARFYTEAETVARLRHPNVVEIFEVGEARGQPYMAIEYVEGTNLAGKLSGTPLPGRQAAGFIEKLARAIHVAHGEGIIHRDLKPSNVLLTTDGTPKITDFGLAKHLDRNPRAAPAGRPTESGTILGTPSYMAPEQAAGKGPAVGPPADIYALGAMLYELVTGRPPFTGETPVDTVVQVVHADPIPPSRLQPKLPRDLETICLKCLQKEPRHRYASALELAEDLRRFQAGEPIQARPTPAWERARKWARRQPATAALTAVSIVIAALGIGLVTWQWQRAEDKAAAEATSRREVERLTASLALDRGLRLCEHGHLRRGLLWMARGRDIAARVEDADLERAIGINLACWGQQLSRPHLVRLPHGPVVALAFSPDGRTILMAGRDGLALLWERGTNRAALGGTSLRHAGPIGAVAFSPDGRMVLTAGEDGTARLWAVATQSPQGIPLRHAAAVRAAAYSPDGRLILTGGDDGSARFWEAATQQPFGTPLRHGARVLALAFSPDGRSVVTGGEDGRVQLWDPATQKRLALLPPHPGPVWAVAFSPDGKTILTGSSDGVARLWEVGAGVRLVTRLRHYARAVRVATFSPSGHTILTGTEYGEARLWDGATGQPLGEPLWQHYGPVTAAAFSPDGQIVVTGGVDGAQLWTAPVEQARGAPLPHRGAVHAVAYNPDGRTLATGGRDGVQLWDVAGRRRIGQPLPHAHEAFAVAYSPDGQALLTGSRDGTARLWEAATGKPVGQPLKHPGPVLGVAFSPDGKTLLTSCGRAEGKGGEVRRWDAATGLPLGPPSLHPKRIYAVGFRPDGLAFLTGGDDNMVQFWAVATGRPSGPPLSHRARVAAVAFSPDGRTIVTGSYDKTACLWDAATGLPIGQPLAHRQRVQAVAFAPDGKTVVTGCYDGTAQLWDVATGIPLGPPLLNRGPTLGVSFHPDGRGLATASGDGNVRFWGVVTAPWSLQDRMDLWREAGALMEFDFSGLVRELDEPGRSTHPGKDECGELCHE